MTRRPIVRSKLMELITDETIEEKRENCLDALKAMIENICLAEYPPDAVFVISFWPNGGVNTTRFLDKRARVLPIVGGLEVLKQDVINEAYKNNGST